MVELCSDRLLTVQDIVVVVVYIPTADHLDEEVQEKYDNIEFNVGKGSDYLIVLGDFNTVVEGCRKFWNLQRKWERRHASWVLWTQESKVHVECPGGYPTPTDDYTRHVLGIENFLLGFLLGPTAQHKQFLCYLKYSCLLA